MKQWMPICCSTFMSARVRRIDTFWTVWNRRWVSIGYFEPWGDMWFIHRGRSPWWINASPSASVTNQKKVSVQNLKLLCLCNIKEMHRQHSREKQEMTKLCAEVDQIQPMRSYFWSAEADYNPGGTSQVTKKPG